MKLLLNIAFLLFIFQFLSCDLNKKLNIKDLNLLEFKKDKLACTNTRQQMIKVIELQKKQFLGITENEIYYALGKYDYQTIDNKNEKVFVYFLEHGAQCENLRNRTQAKCLVLKFNSVSLVKEVLIQKGGFE